jgi:hypothetical protein
MNRARRTYHSGETTDLDLVVRTVVARAPMRPVGLAGISLGGNVLLKWLGERGDTIPTQVRGAVAVSTPCDLGASADRIERGVSRLYQWNFIRKLRRKALDKLVEYPDVADPARVAAARTFRDFDGCFTAPLHGFRDAEDYYAQCSSMQYLARIRTRTLLLSARDDPLLPDSITDEVARRAAGNQWLEVEQHDHGGHVGFVGGPPWRPMYYVERRVEEYLRSCLPQSVAARSASHGGTTLPAPHS